MEEPVGSPPREGVGILLLVDDEANIVAALRRLLRRDGYTLLSAGSGEEGLALLATQAVDVILSDQRMPGMSGVEFLRQAKILRPDTVRLVLSGYTELQSITNAINEGAIFKFLTKPWDDEQLRANIAEAFSFKRLADENRRLSTQLREANAQLERMLADKQGQIVRERRTMGVLHELLQALPWPLLGVDEAGMVVAANAQLENLLGSAAALLGGDSDAVLPAALARFAAGGGDDETVLALCGADYRVLRRQLGERSGAAGKLLILLPEGKCDG